MLTTYEVDIVLTDIEMPEGSGLELIRWVKENKPEIACIFIHAMQSFPMPRRRCALGLWTTF